MLGVALTLRMPVSLLTRNLDVPPAVLALQGSPMAGQARLEGGYALKWESAIKMLPLPHLRTDLSLEGADTRLSGWGRTGFRGIGLYGASGRAGLGLAALVPGAWACDMTATVRDVSLFWGWQRAEAGGAVTTPKGVCAKETREVMVPALRLDLAGQGMDALARLSVEGAGEIAQIRLGRARLLDIAIKPAAADIFPALPRGGPVHLQLPF